MVLLSNQSEIMKIRRITCRSRSVPPDRLYEITPFYGSSVPLRHAVRQAQTSRCSFFCDNGSSLFMQAFLDPTTCC
jgi:hypothetical protein